MLDGEYLPLRDAQTLQQAQSLGHWGPTYSLNRGVNLAWSHESPTEKRSYLNDLVMLNVVSLLMSRKVDRLEFSW